MLSLSRFRWTSLFILLVFFATTASALPIHSTPSVSYSVHALANTDVSAVNAASALPNEFVEDGQFFANSTTDKNIFYFGDSQGGDLRVVDEAERFIIELSGLVDIDPFINFSIAVVNFTNASLTYTFSFSSPVAGGPFGSATASLSAGITDVQGNGVLVSNMSLVSAADASNLGVDVGPTNCSGSGSGPAASYVCGPYGPLQSTFPAVNYATLSTILKFTLSPHDSAAFSGVVALNPVPEPATLLLLGGGIVGVLARRRRV